MTTAEKVNAIRALVYPYLRYNTYWHDLTYCDQVYQDLVSRRNSRYETVPMDVVILIAYFHITGEYENEDLYETISTHILDNHKKQLMNMGFRSMDIALARQCIQEHRNINRTNYKGWSNFYFKDVYTRIKRFY